MSTRLTKKDATDATLEVVSAGRHELLKSREVGLDDFTVTLEGEDQGHVDAAAFGYQGLDCSEALVGGRDLDQQVRLVDALVELAGRLDRAGGVVGEERRDLYRDEAVTAGAGVEHGSKDSERPGDICDHQVPVGLLHALALRQGGRELLVVVVARGDRLGHDGRVRGEPSHSGGDELGQAAGGQIGALQIVEPGALPAALVEILQFGHISPYYRARIASSSRAFWAT